MPVVSGVVTLDRDTGLQTKAIKEMREDSRVTVGQTTRNRVPVVVCSDSNQEDKVIWEKIAMIKGVIAQHYVFANFEDVIEKRTGGTK